MLQTRDPGCVAPCNQKIMYQGLLNKLGHVLEVVRLG